MLPIKKMANPAAMKYFSCLNEGCSGVSPFGVSSSFEFECSVSEPCPLPLVVFPLSGVSQTPSLFLMDIEGKRFLILGRSELVSMARVLISSSSPWATYAMSVGRLPIPVEYSVS